MALTYVESPDRDWRDGGVSSHRGLAGELASVRSTPCPRPLSGPGVFPGVFRARNSRVPAHERPVLATSLVRQY